MCFKHKFKGKIKMFQSNISFHFLKLFSEVCLVFVFFFLTLICFKGKCNEVGKPGQYNVWLFIIIKLKELQ